MIIFSITLLTSFTQRKIMSPELFETRNVAKWYETVFVYLVGLGW